MWILEVFIWSWVYIFLFINKIQSNIEIRDWYLNPSKVVTFLYEGTCHYCIVVTWNWIFFGVLKTKTDHAVTDLNFLNLIWYWYLKWFFEFSHSPIQGPHYSLGFQNWVGPLKVRYFQKLIKVKSYFCLFGKLFLIVFRQ